MNGYNASARVQRTNANVFAFDPSVQLPDTVGM